MADSLGTRLREQRERRGVTLSAIADETKINIALLDGLERDDVSRWPGGLFRRAYLKSYARAVGLDPESTLKEFLEVHPPPVEAFEAADALARARANGGFLRSGIAALRREMAPREAAPVRDARVPEAASVEPPAPAPPPPVSALPPPVPALPPPPEPLPDDGLVGSLASMARLCTALGCAQNQHTVQQVLADAARVLEARGIIVWVWDGFRSALLPAIAHGYPEGTLRHLAALGGAPDSPVAAAFRTAEMQVVAGSAQDSGAVVAPLLTAEGCIGVLAIEFRNGGERREATQAFSLILGAQISTLLPAPAMPHAASA